MIFSLPNAAAGLVLYLIQVLAAVPWVAAVSWNMFRPPPGARKGLLSRPEVLVALVVVGVGALVSLGFFTLVQDNDTLRACGRGYGSILQAQLSADFVAVALGFLLVAWPKGGAVALAAFREGVRQPMYWLLVGFALLAMWVSPYIPYFTFGEDHKMVEELGYDSIMLITLLFGTLAASMSISEEIEGKTAITLMSKPVSRRQFLLGKFLGILLACAAMMLFLGWWFDWVMLYKRWYDSVEAATPPTPLTGALQAWLPSLGSAAVEFCRGAELWALDAVRAAPGLVLGFCQVMVLLAVAVSLATRLPMVINLVICLGVYFLGHLTPVLVQIARERSMAEIGGILYFMAQLFDTLLPGLDYFTLGTAVVRDNPLPTGPFLLYIGSVVGYAVLYTLIVLFFGLILFEDRDLA
jgi:ABC-type transport system involved in multi-copper enzyme maturation permease subunit